MEELIITPAEVLEYAFTAADRIGTAAVRPVRILSAQERFIRPAFGDAMYEQLAGGAWPEFAREYVKPALAHYVRYQMIPELAVSVGDRGVAILTSEQTDTELSGESSGRTLRQENSAGQSSRETSGRKENSSEQTLQQETSTRQLDESSATDDRTATTLSSTDSTDLSERLTRSLSEASGKGEGTLTDKEESARQLGEGEKSSEESLSRQDKSTQKKSSEASQRRLDTTTQTGEATSSEQLSGNESRTVDATLEQSADNKKAENRRRVLAQPASPAQCRRTARLALQDANLLLRRALRYVETHPEEFPDYDPCSPGLTRRVRGDILL